MDLKLSKKLKGKQEKKDGVETKLCIWITRDTLGERLKKDGVGWIVDLK